MYLRLKFVHTQVDADIAITEGIQPHSISLKWPVLAIFMTSHILLLSPLLKSHFSYFISDDISPELIDPGRGFSTAYKTTEDAAERF